MKNLRTEKFEKRLYIWIFDHRFKIAFILLLYFFLSSVSRLPYLNLFFTSDMISIILLVLSILVFNIKISNIYKIGIFLFIPAFLFYILDRVSLVEFIGNCIYAIFLIGVIKGITNLPRDSND